MTHKIRVWDLPTRLFHWSLALCVVAMVVTASIGGELMLWHFRIGAVVLSLLLFRLVWGFMGGHWSRFSSFVHRPSTVLAYLSGRGLPEHSVGHNPLGAGSVLALLFFLFLQVLSGSLSDDEIAFAGPLAQHVSNASVALATTYHKVFGKYLLLALVLLHVAAILFYRIRKKVNLAAAMLHGDKHLEHPAQPSRDDARSRTMAVVVFVACAALVAGAVQLVD